MATLLSAGDCFGAEAAAAAAAAGGFVMHEAADSADAAAAAAPTATALSEARLLVWDEPSIVTMTRAAPATAAALGAIKTLLRRGYIFLPEGEHANVISFTPPLTITRAQLARAVAELHKALAAA